MTKSNFKFVVLALFAIGLTITSCSNKSTDSAETEQSEDQSENSSIYACPMHLEITGEKGDSCPKCGMDLKLISGKDHEEHNH
jgi:hypothetical protein